MLRPIQQQNSQTQHRKSDQDLSNMKTLRPNLQQNRHLSHLGSLFQQLNWLHCHTPKSAQRSYILNDLVMVPLFWQAVHILKNCAYDSRKKNSRPVNVRQPRGAWFPANLSKKDRGRQRAVAEKVSELRNAVDRPLMQETMMTRTVSTAMKSIRRDVQEKCGWCAMNATDGHIWSVQEWTKMTQISNVTFALTDYN